MISDRSNLKGKYPVISYLYEQTGKFCSKVKPTIFKSNNILKLEWTVYDAKVVLTNDIVSKKSKITIERIEGESSSAESGRTQRENHNITMFLKGLGKDLNLMFCPEVAKQGDRTTLQPLIYKDRDSFVKQLNVFIDLLKAEHNKWKKPVGNYIAMKVAQMKGHLRNGRIKNPEIINKYKEEIEKYERSKNDI